MISWGGGGSHNIEVLPPGNDILRVVHTWWFSCFRLPVNKSSRVVFPQPEGPMMATSSPVLKYTDTVFRTCLRFVFLSVIWCLIRRDSFGWLEYFSLSASLWFSMSVKCNLPHFRFGTRGSSWEGGKTESFDKDLDSFRSSWLKVSTVELSLLFESSSVITSSITDE